MKKWYKSKTLWANILTLILTVVATLIGVVQQAGKWFIILTVVNALVNGILRIWFTDTAIGSSPPIAQDGTTGVPMS